MSDWSVQTRDVSHSAVVTGDGNTVTLTFGDSGVSIPLLRKQFPPPERRRRQVAGEPPREIDLLVPETGTLPRPIPGAAPNSASPGPGRSISPAGLAGTRSATLLPGDRHSGGLHSNPGLVAIGGSTGNCQL